VVATGTALPVAAKRVIAGAQDGGGAPKRPENHTGIHKPSSNRRPIADTTINVPALPSRSALHGRFWIAESHVDQVPQCRQENDAARGEKQHETSHAPPPARGSQQLIFAHEDGERRDADQRQDAAEQGDPPQPVGAQGADSMCMS